jgi:hypothetical protein
MITDCSGSREDGQLGVYTDYPTVCTIDWANLGWHALQKTHTRPHWLLLFTYVLKTSIYYSPSPLSLSLFVQSHGWEF